MAQRCCAPRGFFRVRQQLEDHSSGLIVNRCILSIYSVISSETPTTLFILLQGRSQRPFGLPLQPHFCGVIILLSDSLRAMAHYLYVATISAGKIACSAHEYKMCTLRAMRSACLSSFHSVLASHWHPVAALWCSRISQSPQIQPNQKYRLNTPSYGAARCRYRCKKIDVLSRNRPSTTARFEVWTRNRRGQTSGSVL